MSFMNKLFELVGSIFKNGERKHKKRKNVESMVVELKDEYRGTFDNLKENEKWKK